MKYIPRRLAPLFWSFLAGTFGLAGCSTEVPYKVPFFNFASSYNAAPSGSPVLLTNDAWWKRLDDRTLDKLVARALDGNIDLGIARERVIEAHSNLEGVPTLGEVNPSASVRRRKGIGTNASSTERAEAAVGINWLFDPYGSRRQQINAAGARVEVAGAEVDAARLLLILNIANSYIDLRSNQRLLVLRHQQLASRRRTTDLTQKLFDQGSTTRVEVARTNALVAETQTQIPPLMAEIQSLKNQIAVLTGVAPGRLDINLAGGKGQPRPNLAPNIGIPADLLRNRPDIRIAERRYYAAVSEIGVARANLYPRLSLGGSIGAATESGNSGIEYFFGPSIVFPSLLNNSVKARVAARHSQARQAHEAWKSTVLSALAEIENARLAYEGSTRSVRSAQRSATFYREARDLTRDLVERGSATIRDLIDTEEDIADADVVLSEARRQLGRNFVLLNISLGAGSNVAGVQDRPVPSEVVAAVGTE